MTEEVIRQTASLFGDLWHRYDDALFEESVALFAKRFEANGFDLAWFAGKTCLDVGCGGGRYSIAMARLGARAIGCDISYRGLADANRRSGLLGRVGFACSSALDLALPDSRFDFVCCSGVLHHTSDPERGLGEIARVLRPGGRLFLLLYGAGGLRWPTIMRLRPHADRLGLARTDEAIRRAGLPANKQRTFLDDLFVPLIRFYEWGEVRASLEAHGFSAIERWERGKLDHEASIPVQREELEQLRAAFGAAPDAEAVALVTEAIERLDAAERAYASGEIDAAERACLVFGEGHHRVLAVKS